MQIDKFLINIMIFAAIIITGVLMTGDINTSYNISIANDTAFTNIYGNSTNIIGESYDLATGQKEKTYGANLSTDTTEESMFKGAFGAIRLTKDSFGLVGNVLKVSANKIGVPTYFITTALASIAFLVVFSLIYLIFRFKS